MRLVHLERDDFLSNYLDLRPGEHVNVISPTGAGKTHLLYSMLERQMESHPDLSVCSFMPKPRDSSTVNWANRLNLRETDQWPPRKRRMWEEDPRGYVLWPKHIKDDEEANRENLTHTFRTGINNQYWDGDSITLVDDAYVVGVLLGLNPELDRHWIAGRSSGASLWTALQKPSGTTGGAISSFAYDSPTHMFFGRDNDERNLKRISEIAISSVDPREVADVVRNLPVHRIGDSAVSDLLYLDRRGPFMAIVRP